MSSLDATGIHLPRSRLGARAASSFAAVEGGG